MVKIKKYQHASYLEKLLHKNSLKKIIKQCIKTLERYRFDTIAFRGMSGALLAVPLAVALNKELLMVRKHNECHSGYKVEGHIASRKYIIVDDFVYLGTTVKAIQQEIFDINPRARCIGILETVNKPMELTKEYLTKF